MGYVLDLIIVALFAGSIAISVKRGFVKTLIGSLALIAALVVTLLFFAPLRDIVKSSSAADDIRQAVGTKLEEICPADDGFDMEKLLEDRPEEFMQLLDRFGISVEDLEAKADEWMNDQISDAQQSFTGYIADGAVSFFAGTVSFIVLFVGTFAAVKLLAWFADRVFSLPVLRQADKLLAFISGVVGGVIAVLAFTAIVSPLIPYLESEGWRVDPEASLIFRWLYGDNNIIYRLIA